MQHGGCACGKVEAGVGQTGEDRCGVEVAGGLLEGVSNDGSLGLACSEDDGHGLGVVGDGVQSDGDYRLDSGDLDASEVARSGSLCLVVGVGQTGGGVRVAAADIECDVSVGAYTSEEEPDAAHVPDFLVVVSAPVVNHEDGLLLHVLNCGLGVAVTQAQVYHSVGEYLGEVLAVYEGNLLAVDEDALRCVQAEVLDVIFLHIVVEAVVLAGVNRVEFVNLDEVQSPEVGFLGDQKSALLAGCGAFFGVPFGQNLLDPRDEVLGSLAGGEADYSVRMLRCPFQESECCQLAQFGEILHCDVRDVGRKSVFY